MTDLFIKALNMSLNAGWLVIAVIILRFILTKTPKWIHCLMWCIVGLRLVIPFSIQSILSLIPSTEVIPQGIELTSTPAVNSGLSIVDNAVNPIIYDSFAPDLLTSANPLQIYLFIGSIIWLAGIAVMLLYCAVSYISLRIKVRASVLYRDNIYYCDNIDTPFILGIIKPKIYLPSALDEQSLDYVIKHENAHLKRGDHITKLTGYLLLCVYWFDPLVWVAYILLCRDIEKACDQKAVQNMDTAALKAYASALLCCSIKRTNIAACPLAFGEVGVKGRIKAVLNYKKPAFWIIIVAIVLCTATAVCFLTDPVSKEPSYNKAVGNVTVIENALSDNGVSIRLVEAVLDGDNPYFDVEWINNSSQEKTFGMEFNIYRIKNDKMISCAVDELYFHSIAVILNPKSTHIERYHLNAFDLSNEGTYRFIIDDFPSRELWFDFEIKNTALSTVGGADSSGVIAEQ